MLQNQEGSTTICVRDSKIQFTYFMKFTFGDKIMRFFSVYWRIRCYSCHM